MSSSSVGIGSPGFTTFIEIGSPSKSGSLNNLLAFLKSNIVKYVLPKSSLILVPLPIICLNSVIELILESNTINLQVLQSAPVVSNLLVVTIVGYFSSTSIKFSN